MFRVDPKTFTRWAKAGKLTSIRTLGGHRRYPEAEIRSILNRSAQTGPGTSPPGLGQPVMTTPGPATGPLRRRVTMASLLHALLHGSVAQMRRCPRASGLDLTVRVAGVGRGSQRQQSAV
jgi:hypothetical protein